MFYNDHAGEREAWNSQVAENSARHAWAWGNVHTLGWGEVVLEEPIMFGITFVYQPTVAYGWAMDDEDQLVDLRYPRCSGGVLRWIRTANDFYVGAHVFITVATSDPMLSTQAWIDASLTAGAVAPPEEYTEDPGYDLTHSFTFGSMAIKDVG